VSVTGIVSEIVIATLRATERGTETEKPIVIVTLTGHLVRGVMMTVTMIVSGETGRTNGSGNTAAELTEVRMMSSPMEMSDHQVHDAGDKMTKMRRLAKIRETQRYVNPN
jgi:hypothetical protein